MLKSSKYKFCHCFETHYLIDTVKLVYTTLTLELTYFYFDFIKVALITFMITEFRPIYQTCGIMHFIVIRCIIAN